MPDHYRQQPKDPMGPRSPGNSPLALVMGSNHRDQAAHVDPHHAHAHHLHHNPHSPNNPKNGILGSRLPTPPPAHYHPQEQHYHRSSPSRSSGYSGGGSPDHQMHHENSYNNHDEDVVMSEDLVLDTSNSGVDHEEEVVDDNNGDGSDAPLALVVDKTKLNQYHDSGHEDDFSGGSSPVQHGEHNNTSTMYNDIHPNVTIAKVNDPHEQGPEDLSMSTNNKVSLSSIKIKDFAKHIADDNVEGHHRPQNRSSLSHDDNQSDVMSEISSADTWATDISSAMAKRQLMPNGDVMYPCDYCDKMFANRSHLHSHLVMHTGEKNFTCSVCAKSFGRKSSLRAHMTTHTKTSNFMCPVCEKACNDNNSLEEHIRMHTGEKPFVCAICFKAYARKSHLNVHYRVHTGERPFVCADCGKDFTEKRFLNDHRQTAHCSGHEGPLKCPNCFREFAYKTSLKQHLKKQMCAKNLNRGQGNTNHSSQNGGHSKQFQCPFCEKSYSWKQTLKQHVSMYHRNKVHTDEFWKYELAKHRRVGADNSANEDMWRRQLGKHAAEDDAIKNNSAGTATTPIATKEIGQRLNSLDNDKSDNERWLEQIHKSTEKDREQVATEMKLIAMQSLQSSLNMMSMELKNRTTLAPEKLPQHEHEQEEDEDDGASPVADPKKIEAPVKSVTENTNNYLTLLAQLRQGPQSQDKIGSLKDLSPGMIKEEPAVKRTQMWLAQLGQYTKRPSIQDDLDKSHDELWEEQIARTKLNPVKSPLEQSEDIVMDDSVAAKTTVSRPSIENERTPAKTTTCSMVIPPLMSALMVHPAPAGFKPKPVPSATITRPVPVEIEEANRALYKPNYPEKIENKEINESQDQKEKKLTLPLESNVPEIQKLKDFSLQNSIPRRGTFEDERKSEEDQEQPSFLKSLLLDRSGRKRPSMDPPSYPQKTSAHAFMDVAGKNSNDSYNHDILRRRLLGLKDPIPPTNTAVVEQKSLPVKQQQQAHLMVPVQPSPPHLKHAAQAQAPSQKREQTQHVANNNNSRSPRSEYQSSGNVAADNAKMEPKHGDNVSVYSRTSVLKHLLHRYNENGNAITNDGGNHAEKNEDKSGNAS